MKKIITLVTACIVLFGATSTEYAKNNYNVTRIYGANRYETAVDIASRFNGDNVENVIIASGNDFPDALTGSILSKKLNAPILLADKSISGSMDSINYIKKHLCAKGNIYILGGNASISEEYENQLKILGNYNIKRLEGKDRFSTNSTIISSANVEKGTPVIIVNGFNFADALSISNISASKGYPIIMSKSDKLTDKAREILKNIEPSQVFIVGGQSSINNTEICDIKDTIKGLDDSKIIRIGGLNRYETSINICKYFDLKGDTVFIASGENFPDALSGSSLAAKLDAPVILTNGKDTSMEKNYLCSTNYNNVILLGGEFSTSNNIEKTISNETDPDNNTGNSDENFSYGSKNGVNNRTHNGIATSYKGWIYYTNSYYTNLYRINNDNSKKEKLSDGSCNCVNISYDQIYYCEGSYINGVSGRIIKMNLDGTDKKVLSDNSCASVYVDNGWIYYAGNSITNERNESYKFYKMKTDGSCKTKINDDYPLNINTSGNWIYYMNFYKDSKWEGFNEKIGLELCRVQKDGSYKQKLVDKVESFAVVGSNIFYTNCSDGNKIYRIGTDGVNTSILNGDHSDSINYYNGWIYYTNSDDNGSLYRIKEDGSNRTKLIDKRVLSPNIADDWIFYEVEDSVMNTVKTKINGNYSEIIK